MGKLVNLLRRDDIKRLTYADLGQQMTLCCKKADRVLLARRDLGTNTHASPAYLRM